MSQQVATLKEQTKTFGDLLEKYKGTFADLLPKNLSIDRMFRLGQLSMSRQPLLAQCSMASLLSSMMKSAEMGLEPDGTKAALVPFKNNKTQKMEATLIPMWQGLAELVRNTGEVAALDTDIVYEHDKFIFIKGLEPKLEHSPAMRGDRGDIIGAWAMVKYKDGAGSDQEWMSKEEIDKIRGRSRAKDYGPWSTDYTEMARKTVFKRLCKRLPKSTGLILAMDAENRFEAGEVVDMVALPELPQDALPEPQPTATEKLAEKTRKKPGPKPKQEQPEPPQEAQMPEPEESSTEEKKIAPEHLEKIKTMLKSKDLDPGMICQEFEVGSLEEMDYNQGVSAMEWVARIK